MQTQNELRLRLAQERRSSEMRAAADARLAARQRRSGPRRRPFRRALGNRIIAFGARLAADSSFQSARSR